MNNVKGRTREERVLLTQRDNIEKSYINNRIGYEARNIEAKNLIYDADVKSSLYCNENQRFDKDFSIFDKGVRETKF